MLSDHNKKYSDRMERSYKAFAVTFELRFPFPLNAHDVSENCTNFYEKIHTFYNTNFPLIKQSRKRSKDKKWLTGNLKECKRKKNSFTSDNSNHQRLITYKNIRHIKTF